MKPFNTLTERGKVRRLRALASLALTHYPIATKRLSFLTTATNTLFRVDVEDGKKYALRICEPGEHSEEDAALEAVWLAYLEQAGHTNVPRIIQTAEGKNWTVVQMDGVPEPRRCVLFSWIPGRLLDDELTAENYRKLGVLTARLHSAAEQFEMPAGYRPMQWDTTFYWPHEPVVIDDPAYAALFSAERRQTLHAIIERVNAYLFELYRKSAEPIIIHADLHMWNVHVQRGRLYALDFEDLMLGYPVQDIAITFYYTREDENGATLHEAYREGYTTERSWPVRFAGELELLMAGRMVMFCNYVAHSMTHAEAEPYIDRWAHALQNFIASGFLRWQ